MPGTSRSAGSSYAGVLACGTGNTHPCRVAAAGVSWGLTWSVPIHPSDAVGVLESHWKDFPSSLPRCAYHSMARTPQTCWLVPLRRRDRGREGRSSLGQLLEHAFNISGRLLPHVPRIADGDRSCQLDALCYIYALLHRCGVLLNEGVQVAFLQSGMQIRAVNMDCHFTRFFLIE